MSDLALLTFVATRNLLASSVGRLDDQRGEGVISAAIAAEH